MSEKVSYQVMIRDLPTELRPRERLLREGAENLSDVELLAILLRTGTRQESALQLAQRILAEVGGLRYLAERSFEELSRINGVGPAKVAQVKSAIELGRRLAALQPEQRPQVRSPQDVVRRWMPRLRFEQQEHLIVILLNTKNEIIAEEEIFVGTLDSSIAHPREVFKSAIRRSSAALILLHNHPSGDPTPSGEDIRLTRQMAQAGEILGIEVLDHVILGDQRYRSLREEGVLPLSEKSSPSP
jgi:DNA repair protein RadC